MITVAIIGAGIGREHLDGYLTLPGQFRVKTLCDIDESRAREVIASNDILSATDFQQVLADNEIDLVDICLPPHMHLQSVLDVLDAGKHVVCEKPLVTSLEEVDQIIAASQSANKQVFPVFQYRYGLAMAQLHALIDAGLAGSAYSASLETHWSRDEEYYAVPWRGTWDGERGGAVLGHAIHNHDLLTTIFGPIAQLSAFTTTRVNDIEVEDCAAISFQMLNGAVATSSITLGASADTSRLRFCFEKLTAQSGSAPYSPMTDCWTFSARNPEMQAEVDAVIATVSDVKSGFAGFFEAIGDALSGVSRREVTLDAGRRSIELVSAIYQSSHSGEIATLPLDKNSTSYKSWIPEQRLNQ